MTQERDLSRRFASASRASLIPGSGINVIVRGLIAASLIELMDKEYLKK
jgi:hypothetical protein